MQVQLLPGAPYLVVTYSQLKLAREFLETNFWKQREGAVMKLPGDPISYGQCDFSSVFLILAYGEGKLQGGFGWEKGIAVSGGWKRELHYWVQLANGDVADIAQDQFHTGNPVVLAKKETPEWAHYVSSFDSAHLSEVFSFWKKHPMMKEALLAFTPAGGRLNFPLPSLESARQMIEFLCPDSSTG